MSDMFDYDEIHDLHDKSPRNRKQTRVWTSKDGKRIRICDMDDRHLINTIKMLRRKAGEVRLNIQYPNFIGEMAQYEAERWVNNILEMSEDEWTITMYPIYEIFMFEYLRRQLKEKDL